MTDSDENPERRVGRHGGLLILLLFAGIAASPLLLVFSPLIPLAVLVYAGIRKRSLGRAWGTVWWAAWASLAISLWPLLGLDLGIVQSG